MLTQHQKQASSTIHVGSNSFAGTWHLIETFVRLDSTIDLRGGSHHLFVDNELVASIEHVAYNAKKMSFGLNAVYVHSTLQQAPNRAQTMIIDNLVVSTQRVGAPGVRPNQIPTWPGATITLATPLVNSHIAMVDLSVQQEHMNLLSRCWKSHFYFMFVDEACHLAWLYQLQSTQILVFQQRGAPPPPPPSLAGHGAHAYTKWQTHGLIQVRLPDEKEGFFLGCDDTDGPSYKAELLAYHIDRLLGIDRVPATVARTVTEDEARRGLGDHAVIAQLKACAPDDVMRVVGSLSGWPHEDIESTDVISEQLHDHTYVNGDATPNEVELSRLIIGLLLQGLPRKIQTDSIIDIEEPDKGKKSARHLFVNPSNSMARWDEWAPLKPSVPVCNRTTARGTTFTCRLRLPALDKNELVNSTSFVHNEQVANGALLSYLRTACIFPKTVAMRIYHYAADHVSLADTLSHVTRAELTAATSLKRFKGSVLDKRLYDIFLALGECAARYGHRSTIFDDPVSYRVHAPPKVHVDPAGTRYWKNETTGVWMKLQKAADGLPEHALDEAPFLVAAAPFAELPCHVRDECGACLASPKCKWCMRERICSDNKVECSAGITVTSPNGCPADSLALPNDGLPYELPIEAPETPSPTPESNEDYLALFGGGGKEKSGSEASW